MHDHNSFITLTYSPENEPKDKSIHKEELQKFFKRLRKQIWEQEGKQIRYFACGEYGEQRNRPHYHAVVFGYEFPDKKIWSQTEGYNLYRSETLEKSWRYGYSTIGSVTFESCAYVARYIMKKHKKDKRLTDEENAEAYKIVDPETGEIYQVEPEFCLMSRRPGIGRNWMEQHKKDTDKDYITINGTVMSLPKYYDSILQQWDEEEIKNRKAKREAKARKKKDEYTDERLRVKQKVKEASLEFLPRQLEKYK